jgi:uncharacterized protein (DUF927 family)
MEVMRMESSTRKESSKDSATKLERALQKLADKYGIYTKEEFFKAYSEMERMDIGIFVAPFGDVVSEPKRDLRSIIESYTYRGRRKRRETAPNLLTN